jgi:hypothetical protein
LALGLLFFLGAEVEGEPDETMPTLIDLDPTEVRGISIERRDSHIDLVMDEAGWSVQSPVEDRANEELVSRLLQALARVSRGSPLANADLAAMGLEPDPVASVRVTVEGGAVTSFQVGERAPVGWHTYLRNDVGAVFAVPGNLTGELSRRGDEYRHPGLIDLELAEITSVRLKSAAGTLDVHKGEQGRWWLGGFGAANPNRVEELLIALSTLRFTTFYHAPLPTIDSPEFEVEVMQGDTRLRLSVGEVTAMGRLTIDAAGRPGFVDPAASIFLTQGPTDLGTERVLDSRPRELARVTLHGTSASVAYDFDGAGWESASDVDGQVDVDACLTTLEQSPFVYLLEAPKVEAEVLTRIEIQGESFSRDFMFHAVDAEFVALSEGAGGGPLRLKRTHYRDIVSACGLGDQ